MMDGEIAKTKLDNLTVPVAGHCPRIEGPDHPAWHVDPIVIVDRGTHNNQIVDDRGRGRG